MSAHRKHEPRSQRRPILPMSSSAELRTFLETMRRHPLPPAPLDATLPMSDPLESESFHRIRAMIDHAGSIGGQPIA